MPPQAPSSGKIIQQHGLGPDASYPLEATLNQHISCTMPLLIGRRKHGHGPNTKPTTPHCTPHCCTATNKVCRISREPGPQSKLMKVVQRASAYSTSFLIRGQPWQSMDPGGYKMKVAEGEVLRCNNDIMS